MHLTWAGILSLVVLESVSAWPQYMLASDAHIDMLVKRETGPGNSWYEPPRDKDGKLLLGEWRAPRENDLRSACPAFNTLANHGVFPRDGQDIPVHLIKEGFNQFFMMAKLSSTFLMNTAKKRGLVSYPDMVDLHTISKHRGVEHDMSLTRNDYTEGATEDPLRHIRINQTLVDQLCVDSRVGSVIPIRKYAEFRLKREQDSAAAYHNPRLADPAYKFGVSEKVTADIQAGNLILLFNKAGEGLDADQLCEFLTYERLPQGYVPPEKEFNIWTTFLLGFTNRLIPSLTREDSKVPDLAASLATVNDVPTFFNLLADWFPAKQGIINTMKTARDAGLYLLNARAFLVEAITPREANSF